MFNLRFISSTFGLQLFVLPSRKIKGVKLDSGSERKRGCNRLRPLLSLAPPQPKWRPLINFCVIRFQAESDIAAKEKNAEQLQDELAAQDESISKLSKEKKNLEEAKQVSNPENIGQNEESERESEVS